jgi:phosphoserine phosphatase
VNLVLSGPIDERLHGEVSVWSKPRRDVTLHAQARQLVEVDDGAAARSAVATLCAAVRVDHAYVDGKRFSDFKLLAMDMDSTLITIECIDEIADFAGKKKEVAAITEAAMRGEIADFAESLRRRVALLAGIEAGILKRVFDERLRLNSGATELLAAARANRIHTLLLSGGFGYFVDRLKAELNLDEARANSLEIENGRLTGRVAEPIVDAIAKRSHVERACARLGCAPSDVLVIGDGANDIPMMRFAGHSVAYHAKPATAAAATCAIRFQSLATVLDYFA